MVRAARAGLTAWREASPSARAIPLSENALGVAMLDFTTRGLLTRRGDALRELCELMLLVPRSTTLIALRRATTAAARLTFGAGRDGNALVAGLKEERCGALLLLLNCLRWPLELSRFAGTAPGVASAAATTSFLESGTDDATALEEYAALKFQIGLAFGQQSDAMDSARTGVAQRLLQLEIRQTLRKQSASNAAAASDDVDALLAPLKPLAAVLDLPPSMLTTTVLNEGIEDMRRDLESALAEWVDAGGKQNDGSTPSGREAQRPSYAKASRAARLASACLRFGGSDAKVGMDLVRSVGLTSSARHAFYAGFVRTAAALEDDEEAGVCSVADAPFLRRLLSVLPATADAAEREAGLR